MLTIVRLNYCFIFLTALKSWAKTKLKGLGSGIESVGSAVSTLWTVFTWCLDHILLLLITALGVIFFIFVVWPIFIRPRLYRQGE